MPLITLTAADGHSCQAYLAEPAGTPIASLVVIQEIFGVNSHIRAVVDGFAADGFRVLAPALFDRVTPGVELGYDAPSVARGREIRGAVPDDAALADITAAAIWLAGRPNAGKVGVIGYCWGGTLAWLAATRSDKIAGAVGYYGGGIAAARAEQPRSPVQLHFGEQDKGIPLSDVAAIEADHPGLPVFRYDADHGFNCDQRGSFNAAAAAQARGRALDFLRRTLT